MFTCGLPLLSMEYAMGQLTRRGPIAAFGSLVPLLKGVPVAAALTAFIVAPLYSTINCWSLFYFFKSFQAKPLWSKCGNNWNDANCIQNSSLVNGLLSNLMNETVPGGLLGDTSSPYIDTELDDDANETMTIPLNQDIAANETTALINTTTNLLYATQQFFE